MKEHILLKTVLRYMENEEVVGDHQHGFTKGKLNLTNLVTVYDRIIVLVENGRATDVTYLDLCKTFDAMDLMGGPFSG